MLYISSFLFATVSYHAAVVGHSFLHKAGLIQYGVSILHHAYHRDENRYHGGRIIAFVDRTVARLAACYIVCEAYMLPVLPRCIIWFLISYGGIIYFRFLSSEKRYRPIHYLLHTSLHMSTVAAAHMLLLAP